MGILSNTTSLCRYTVAGKAPQGDMGLWAGERLAANAFRSIEETTDELSVGWVTLDDFTSRDFGEPGVFRRDRYFTFTLRSDRRKVPAILLRAHLDRAPAGLDCMGCHEPHHSTEDGLLRALAHSPFGDRDCATCHEDSAPITDSWLSCRNASP